MPGQRKRKRQQRDRRAGHWEVVFHTQDEAEWLAAADLATLYLGDASATRLAALGTLTEHTPGAAARTDALFRTSRRPWCPDIF